VSAQCPACGLHELIPVVLERGQEDGRWRQIEPGEATGGQIVRIDGCPVCSGAWFDMGELDDLADEDDAEEESPEQSVYRGVVGSAPIQGNRPCPRGHGPMLEHHLPGRISTPVDRCAECRGLWLDGHERRKLAKASTMEGQQTARERWVRRGAIYAAQLLTQLPVEVENPKRATPWAVFALVGVLVTLFVAQVLGHVDHYAHGIVAGRMLRTWDVETIFTHQFIHKSWIHLLGNLYFLYTFGDNVEHLFGRRRFLVFYILAGVVGGLFHVLLTRATAVVVVGASGAIAGVLAAYLWSFPRARLLYVLFFIQLKLPVWVYLLMWVLFHLAMAFFTHDRSVAWFAHLGGFAFGLAATPWILRARRREVARRVAVPAR
jgi:membrane associated rhomboid family serine protease/Zn-finger nucleic acid-binding protein